MSDGTAELRSGLVNSLTKLSPKDVTSIQKRRYGRNGDGGYVLLNDMHNVSAVYSFGVSNEISFEQDIARYGRHIYMYDHTVEGIGDDNPLLHFQKKGIATTDRPLESLYALDTLIAENGHAHADDLLLKMDIEGDEIAVLADLPLNTLKKFRQICVEVHWLGNLIKPDFRKTFDEAFERLGHVFHIYHVHANNCRPVLNIEGLMVADVLELSLVRTDVVEVCESKTVYPSPYDFPNNPSLPDHLLWFFPFSSNIDLESFRRSLDLSTKTLRDLERRELEARLGQLETAKAARRRVTDSVSLNILYECFHEILAYDDISMLTRLGHRVFCVGPFSLPTNKNLWRKGRPEFYDADFIRQYTTSGFNRDFIDQFDIVICVQSPSQPATDVAQRYRGKPIIYRTIGQSWRENEKILQKVRDSLVIVRYSEREACGSGFSDFDEVIKFSKNYAQYPDWFGGNGKVVTFHNHYVRRSDHSVPTLDEYNSIFHDGGCELYGNLNDGVPAWKGLIDHHQQMDVYRNSDVYFYVHTLPPSYTLNFIEALGVGTPIVAPSARFVMSNLPAVAETLDYTEERYEIEHLLDRDFCVYDSIDDARYKIAELRRSEALRRQVSRNQRSVARENFDEGAIGTKWQKLFRKILG